MSLRATDIALLLAGTGGLLIFWRVADPIQGLVFWGLLIWILSEALEAFTGRKSSPLRVQPGFFRLLVRGAVVTAVLLLAVVVFLFGVAVILTDLKSAAPGNGIVLGLMVLVFSGLAVWFVCTQSQSDDPKRGSFHE
jgi:hypothetical protein